MVIFLSWWWFHFKVASSTCATVLKHFINWHSVTHFLAPKRVFLREIVKDEHFGFTEKKWNTLFFIFFSIQCYPLLFFFKYLTFFETNWDSWLIMLNSYFTSKFSKLVFDWFRVVLLLTFLWGFFMRNCCNGINVQSEEGETSNVSLFHTQLKVNPGSRRGLVWVKFSSFRVLSQHHQHNLIWIY